VPTTRGALIDPDAITVGTFLSLQSELSMIVDLLDVEDPVLAQAMSPLNEQADYDLSIVRL
jgi:hypothetical protein